MSTKFCSRFLETFNILLWDGFDDGANGNVFKVERKAGKVIPGIEIDSSETQFIVKVVKLPSGPEDTSVKELREVELLEETKVDHENVVRIFGNWEERPPLGFKYPNRPPINQKGTRLLFILMEYCDLFTLRRWLGYPRVKRKWADLVNIFVQITKGLVAIHGKGIIHRDLKPSNVGLTCHWTEERVVAKLIDFGLATKLSDEMTSEVGTYVYRSPEIHVGRKYDDRADVYALGIILCQMIVSLLADDVSLAKLENEYIDFMNENMSHSRPPLPFDAAKYFKKYKVAQEDTEVSEMIRLAKKMTKTDPQDRLSSLEVLKSILEVIPGAEGFKVSIYNYLEEVKEKQTCLSASNCKDFRPIKSSRLNHLTHLTLKNISVTKQQLMETVKECLVLKHLSLSLLIPDLKEDELLPMDSICLPHLQTFRFRLHFPPGDTKNFENPEKPYNVDVDWIKSLMFFGPLSQIWKNQMRVKVSRGKRVLLSIDAGRPQLFFYLDGLSGGFEFMEILNNVDIQDVSLKWISGKEDQDVWDLNQCWSAEKKNFVYQLNLILPRLDLMQGRLFQGFNCLTDLSVNAYSVHLHNKIHLNFLPQTITRLVLKKLFVYVDGMSGNIRRNLESLHLIECQVPKAFYEEYSKLFQVECLRVTHIARGPIVGFTPGMSFVESVFSTSNWSKVYLDPFDWTETEENSEFRDELMGSFFPEENEETLFNAGVALELNDGTAKAKLIKEFPLNVFKPKLGSDLVGPVDEVDSDDEEAQLMIQQGVEDFLETSDKRQLKYGAFESLDKNSEAKLVFKGTLEYPLYPEEGWESKVIFQKFLGVPKDKPKLKNIQLKNCSVSSSLSIQLRGCLKLESLVLDMVEWESDSGVKMTAKLPELKDYTVNLYNSFKPPGKLHSSHFTFERFDQLFFFRPRGPERIKGLWGKGIACQVSVQGTLYFQLDKNTLTLQFLPDVDKILKLLELDETLENLKLQCCLLYRAEESLPSFITKLTLRYVDGDFRDVCQLKFLKTLVYEGRRDDIFINLKSIESLESLEHLTLCNVSLLEIRDKLKISLKSCTLSRVNPRATFNETCVKYLNTESLVLADGIINSFNYRTLYSVLKSEDVCIRNVTFINYDTIQVSNLCEDDHSELFFCKSFLLKNEIVGNSFNL